MNWSFRIARVAGIDIKIHITFFLILILGALPWGSQFGLSGALFGVALILLLFLCVTLHELGHGLAARYYGIPVREIVLLPLGGVALLERNPSKPVQELVIALVNVLIALILLVVTGSGLMLGGLDDATLMNSAQEPSLGLLLSWLLEANIALVIFNMIPAFPLDGGRVLRAILAMLMPAQRATAIATAVGQGLAILLGLYGVLNGNFMLVLVAIFIFVGAGQENVEGQARTVLTTLRVGDAYNKYALTLQIGDRVSKVVDYILTSYQPDFAVMQGSHPLGIVTRDDVLRAMASAPDDQYVTMIMRREVLRINADASLDAARQQMSEKGVRVAAVYAGEAYLGLVSLEDIAEAYAVLAFQQRQRDLLAQQAG
jgi:Zn-dependent protease/propanediol dehydratase small subunit